MKKCNAVRNLLLPIVAIVAMTFAGSCSKYETVEPDETDAALETRATPRIRFFCTPETKGEGQNLLSLKQTYRFAAGMVIEFSPTASILGPCDYLSVQAADGSKDGYEIVTGENEDNLDTTLRYLYVKFTKPGYYYIKAQGHYKDVLYEQTWTYCVVSRAKSITLPESIELGVPFDLEFVFEDTRYPAPALDVTETLFNNPQYTVLSNDGHGRIRMSLDQPGKYLISTGLGGIYSSWADIKLYWRPENVKSESKPYLVVYPSKDTSYKNEIFVCDAADNVYTFLPYGVYFGYKLYKYENGQSLEVLGEEGEKLCTAGSNGIIRITDTNFVVPQVRLSWALTRVLGHYWYLTIPDDEIHTHRVFDPDVVGPFDPDEPGGGIIGPLDPPGGGTIIQ